MIMLLLLPCINLPPPPRHQGKRCMVSGSGNVAQYAAKKLIELGAVVLTMSDSTGYIYEPNGFSMEQVDQVMNIKNKQRTTLAAYKSSTGEICSATGRMCSSGTVVVSGVVSVDSKFEFTAHHGGSTQERHRCVDVVCIRSCLGCCRPCTLPGE
jgi:hypothetical protein